MPLTTERKKMQERNFFQNSKKITENVCRQVATKFCGLFDKNITIVNEDCKGPS
jgi:hypothetical protein